MPLGLVLLGEGVSMLIEITQKRLEPGRHILRKAVEVLSLVRVDIPDEECKECRPDWGEYRPLVTFPAIERALRSHDLLPWCGPDEVCYLGIVKS